jgi:hypothetical protein
MATRSTAAKCCDTHATSAMVTPDQMAMDPNAQNAARITFRHPKRAELRYAPER